MAYMSTETAKKIRQALKAEFPNVKFSVTKHDHIALNVSVIKSSLFDDGIDESVNHYWIDQSSYNDEQKSFLKKVDEIIRVTGDYFDKSDSMSGLCHTAFFYDINIGKWDKPHQKI